eukprot:CAMPEP_0185592976 /NCGR_PEP_ID=MMETSP0434-20130131/69908_1 /TAXON_ID=626734 ORGANISM="Favella taraikaensis, Strain Fe Narragansett Bay" /NCGR_SAMPLE_ID=MMETSP0434 /ASSEMBLY_ACC=CAM_ASM_000379 /LENGTH=45 /DNA_ID= /DNA_START= /DNA_END= /DNA_ORIENTATION=
MTIEVPAGAETIAVLVNASMAVYMSWAMLIMMKSSSRSRFGFPKG